MPNLTTDQAAAVSREGGALLVSAAAGSGKTMVLVERLLRQLEAGHDLTEFLIITYTNAAAAELRGKIAARLSRALAEQPDNRHLRRQTHLLYLAQISTIHAFCGTLLRQYAHLRDLPPEFRVADEQQVRLLRQQVMERLLVERYEQAEPGFLALAETMGSGRSDSRLTAAALSLYDTLRTHARPEQWLDQCRAQLALDGVTDAGATVWGAETLDWLRQTAAAQCRRLEQALNLAREDEKLARGYAPSLAQTQQALSALSGAESWEQARALLPVPFLRFGAVRGADETAKARITALRDHAKKAASAMETAVYDSSAAVLRDLQGTVPATLALLELAVEFGRRFTREKRRRSMLDFSDLEHETIALLTDRYTGAPTAAAQDVAARYHEVMVDEYQDCNEVQDTIFRAVSGEGTRLFMVGDVKQSIYRFRLADPGIFLEKYRSYQLDAPQGEPCKVLLSRNFRSRAAILEAVNHVFTTCMSAQVGELDYGPDEALHPGAVRVPLPGPAVELHVVTGGDEEQTRVAREAAFVAARIRRMLDEGTPVAGPDGQLRPVTPGDIVILLRSPRSVAADYLAALERWDIPASGGGGGSLLDTTEAQVLLATLRAIDNPHQDIPLAAAMASPVFGFTAEDLAQIRQAAEGDFCTALTARAADDPRCAAFLARLADWRTLSQTQPLPELIWTVMRQTEMEAIFGALPGGTQRRRNLLSLYEASMEFHGGLTAFLDAMELRRTTDGMEPQPVAEGAGCVRLMSIHKSKGLEFPVVFLCDLARSFNLTDLSEPLLCHPRLGVGAMAVDLEQMQQYSTFARSAIRQQLLNETLSEQLRVLYVAMTRASERMILVHCEKKAEAALERAAYGGYPADPYAAGQAACMGHWVLMAALLRPEAGALRHAAGADEAPTVPVEGRWDIGWHETVPPLPEQAARQAAAAAQPPVSAPLAAFADPHAGAAATPSKLTATQLKGRFQDDEAAEGAEVWQPAMALPRFQRPRFAVEQTGLTPAERGVAAHLFMQYADYARCGGADGVRAELARLTAGEFLSPEQAEAVQPETILAFFCSPLGQRVRTAPHLLREFKFSLLDDAARYYPQAGAGEQVLLQGVVDCAILDEGGITVIDFKTDRVQPGGEDERAAQYWGQLTAYARALERIYCLPVRETVLWFFSTGTAVAIPR